MSDVRQPKYQPPIRPRRSRSDEAFEVVAVGFMWLGAIVVVAALIFAIPAVFALLLQFVYGWFAEGNNWRPMPFWVAFGIVMLVGMVTGQMKTKVKVRG